MTSPTIQPNAHAKCSARNKRSTDAKASAPQSPKSVAPRRKAALATSRTDAPRVTKQATLLLLLGRSEGASIDDMMQATGWLPHSVRGFLAGTVKKQGLPLTSRKADGGVRRYRIATGRGR